MNDELQIEAEFERELSRLKRIGYRLRAEGFVACAGGLALDSAIVIAVFDPASAEKPAIYGGAAFVLGGLTLAVESYRSRSTLQYFNDGPEPNDDPDPGGEEIESAQVITMIPKMQYRNDEAA